MNLTLEKITAALGGGSGLLLSVAWKSLVILAVILVLTAAWRRGAAAARHLVWTTTFLCLLCLPALVQLAPAWHSPDWIIPAGLSNRLPELVSFGAATTKPRTVEPSPAELATAASAAQAIGDAPSPRPGKSLALGWRGWLVVVWLAGIGIGGARWLAGHLWLQRLTRRLRDSEDADGLQLMERLRSEFQIQRPVKLLVADAPITPITWGFWRPAVVLPVEARQWPIARRQIVLRHELAHIRRGDWLTQEIAHAACLLYWFNPLVWRARNQMRAEREKACDDCVLNTGARPADYAGHLVEIALEFKGSPQLGGAVAMARPSGLEQRVAAILDDRRNRNRLASLTAVAIAVAIFSLALIVGSYAVENLPAGWSLDKSPVANQLKRFVAEKQAQEIQLIAADQKDYAEDFPSQGSQLVVPDCGPFFAAAGRGDWQTVSNLSADLEHHTLGLSQATNGYPHGRWLNAIRETFGALEAFAVGNEKYSKLFGEEVIGSIPPGSVYFGGTDHGRFVITAMQASPVNGEPFFTLTQNALADGTYLAYLRSMFGEKIHLPTSADSQRCFQDYIADAQVRLKENRLKPGENIKVAEGRVQVSGRTAVMEINGLLVKAIFDKNPAREFFIEESFPLDWMYAYLEPHGFVFKLNRQPLPQLTGTMVQRDQAYWQKLVPGMIGGWLNDNTTVAEITTYAGKVFVRHDLHGFTGDSGFVQNDYTSRMFSKLRISQAGLYAWRAKHAVAAAEKEQMTRAADIAARQAWVLCPYLPEAVYPYVNILLLQNRLADAVLVAQTSAKMPQITGETAAQLRSMIEQIQNQVSPSRPAGAKPQPSVFQLRLVVDEAAADAEKLVQCYTNPVTGQVRQEALFVQQQVLLDQSALKSAQVIHGPQGDRQIEFTLTSDGRKEFARITRGHLHQRLAIIVEGKLLTAPVIQSEIASGTGQITGRFSEADAADLVAKLNAAIGK